MADEPHGPDGPDRQGEACALCAIHVRMDAGDDPWGVARLSTGYVALNADQFVAFLRRLCKDAGQKVFLIVDNLKVHHASKVKTWVAANGNEMKLL